MAVYMKIGYICTIKFLMQTKFNINYLRQWRKVKRGRGYLRKAENFLYIFVPDRLNLSYDYYRFFFKKA